MEKKILTNILIASGYVFAGVLILFLLLRLVGDAGRISLERLSLSNSDINLNERFSLEGRAIDSSIASKPQEWVVRDNISGEELYNIGSITSMGEFVHNGSSYIITRSVGGSTHARRYHLFKLENDHLKLVWNSELYIYCYPPKISGSNLVVDYFDTCDSLGIPLLGKVGIGRKGQQTIPFE